MNNNQQISNKEEKAVYTTQAQIPNEPIGYPDINNVNTKTVVIGSLICIVIIFLLSIFGPDITKQDAAPQQTSTEQTTTTES